MTTPTPSPRDIEAAECAIKELSGAAATPNWLARHIATRVHEAVQAEREAIASDLDRRAAARHQAWESAKRSDDKRFFDTCGTECEKIAAAIRALPTQEPKK